MKRLLSLLVIFVVSIIAVYLGKTEQSLSINFTTVSSLSVINIMCNSTSVVDKKEEVYIDYFINPINQTLLSKIKIQGASSRKYPKKNFTIDIKDKTFVLRDNWPETGKYCLKANYIDGSQSRNIVSSHIFKQITQSRNKEDVISRSFNCGMIDGFPVEIYFNNHYWGLYSLNLSKDEYLFNFSKEKSAIMFGKGWSDSTTLREEISKSNNFGSWVVEYCSTENSDWCVESINNFIRFLNNSTNEEFIECVENYTDVDRAIDTFLFTYIANLEDNGAKNMLWVTDDGTKWIPSMYDMDGSWGLEWDGGFCSDPTAFKVSGSNMLYQRLLDNFYYRIKNRYFELRQDVITVENIKAEFVNYMSTIPEEALQKNAKKWSYSGSSSEDCLMQITTFVNQRLDYLDQFFGD